MQARIGIIDVIGIMIPTIIIIVLLGGIREIKELNDSLNYITFAKSITSGEIFEKRDLGEIPFNRAIRTPGYPIFILASTAGLTADRNNLLIGHLALAIFSIVFLCLGLKAYCPPVVTGTVVVAAQLMMREYYSVIMTEWLAFNLLLILFGLVVVTLRNPSTRNLFLMGLVASFGVLVRPSMLPAMLLMPFLAMYCGHRSFSRNSLLALTALPLLLWMAFNSYHIGAFTIAQLNGTNLFGVGTQIGSADAEPGDSEDLKEFIAAINEKKTPPKGEEDAFVDDLDKNYHKLRFDNNVFWVAYRLQKPEWGVVRLDRDYLGVYGKRAIKNNPGNYIKYIAHGIKVFALYGIPYITILMLAIPLVGLYRNRKDVLSIAALLMFAIHLSHCLLTSAFQTAFFRYIMLTFFPYACAVVLCFCSLVLVSGFYSKLINRLPENFHNTVGRLLRPG